MLQTIIIKSGILHIKDSEFEADLDISCCSTSVQRANALMIHYLDKNLPIKENIFIIYYRLYLARPSLAIRYIENDFKYGELVAKGSKFLPCIRNQAKIFEKFPLRFNNFIYS